MFVIRRLQELARKKQIPLYVCFIDLTKAYDSVDQTLLWTVLARFGVPHNMISAIRQFHNGMRSCVRLDDRVCSGWFTLWNRAFAKGAIINVAYTCFKADKDIIDNLVHLRKKKWAGGSSCRIASPSDAALGHALR